MATKGTIYALAEPGTWIIRYCGKTIKEARDRMYAHKTDAYTLKRRRHSINWMKSVYDRGEKPDVIICEVVSFEGLTREQQLAKINEAERRWIAQLKVMGFDLTNATTGGDGAHGMKLSPERLAKLISYSKGRKKTPEQIERMRAAGLARDPSTYRRGKDHHGFGKNLKFSDNATRIQRLKSAWDDPIKRIEHSERMKGTMSADELAKQSARHTGNKYAARQTREQAVAILQATGTIRAIAQKFGVSHQLVSLIKLGKRWPELHATI